jgi:hypothetical protein
MLLNNTLREAIEDCSVDNFMRIDRKKINNVVDTLKIHDLKKQNKPIKKSKRDCKSRVSFRRK